VETFSAPALDVDPGLPAVCGILQVASEGPLTDTFLYGRAVGGIDPMVLDPLELLDGALTNGAYDWPAVRNVTATYQDSSLLRTLLTAHGERLRFTGIILALGYLDGSFEKQRSAMLSARLARWLGADGAICTTFSSGNSHTDTMLTVKACESLGIRTTAIISETNGGLTDHVAEADSIVSVGNEDELVQPWTPDRVVGAAGAVRSGEPVPTWAYLGACVETGDMSLTAVPA
jgi:glycine reductase